MGLQYSVLEILGKAVGGEEIEETRPDGTVIKTKARNPWVTGVVVIASSGLLIAYMDGGDGMISKSFGRACVVCSKKMYSLHKGMHRE